MIDPMVEGLITPAEATSLYPRGPNGKKVHVSKVYRDMGRGAGHRPRVRLHAEAGDEPRGGRPLLSAESNRRSPPAPIKDRPG